MMLRVDETGTKSYLIITDIDDSDVRKYYKDIPSGAFDFYIAGDIKSKKIDNAISSFAQGVDRSSIIGFYDLTVMGSGKNGYLFTDTKLYYREPLEKPGKIWYEDIKDIKVSALEPRDKNFRIFYRQNCRELLT